MSIGSKLYTGAKTGIGPSGILLFSGASLPARSSYGITIVANSGNTDNIWISANSGLTPGTNDVNDGFPLARGQSYLFPVKNPNQLYVRSSITAGQKAWWYLV